MAIQETNTMGAKKSPLGSTQAAVSAVRLQWHLLPVNLLIRRQLDPNMSHVCPSLDLQGTLYPTQKGEKANKGLGRWQSRVVSLILKMRHGASS